MLVETKELEYCKLEVLYTALPDVVREKEKEAVAALRSVQISGFRKGKAPDYAIRARCKDKIKLWMQRELATLAYDDTIFEKKIKTIGYPQFSDVKLDGNNFSCKMVILKKPDFELKQYKGFDIPKPHMDRDVDAAVEKTIQDLRMRFADVAPYKDGDFVDTGDQVTMNYYSTVDGEEQEKAEGVLYSVGEGKWPALDENMLGMAPGETREFDSTIDGKATKCKVTVHMGMKRVPCPMDDELALKVGLQNFAEVRQKIAVIANEQIKNKDNNLVKQQLILRLLEENVFDVPAWLIDMEVQHIIMQHGISSTESLSDEEHNLFKEKAIKQIKLSLILDSVRDTEPEAVLSDAEAINGLKQQVSMQGQDPEAFVVKAQKSGSLFGMSSQLKDEFALQWLVNNSKVTE
jgi:trigger factor